MFAFKHRTANISLKLLLHVSLVALLPTAKAQSIPEYEIRANLTAQFSHFTTWPANVLKDMGNKITLCLIGDPAIEEFFANIDGKAIGDKSLQVRYLNRFYNLSECQLIYISNLDKNKLLLLLNEIKKLPILTLGENAAFVKNGGMVSIQITNGHPDLVINLKNLNSSNLSISARVLKLATIIQ